MGERYEPEYYSTIYRNYARQNPRYKLEFYRRLVQCHNRAEVPRVLDVGCAFGDFLASLPAVWPLCGIDASSYAIEQARLRNPRAQFAAATLASNPFPGPFHLITSFDVIEHIPDLVQTLKTVYDLLLPSGLFLFVVPVYDGPLGSLVRLLDHDPTHIHKESRRFWIESAAEAFAVEEWLGIYRYLTPLGFYAHWPTKVLRRFSPAIAVVARKS
jgi:SAM-dependent methyltransferase